MTTYYYFYDDTTRIIYYTDTLPLETEFTYLGESTNPNKSMAAHFFVKDFENPTGFKLKPLA